MAHITVSDYATSIQFSVGGTLTTSFTIPASFVFFDEVDDIDVYVDATQLTEGTDYTVTGNTTFTGGFDGGTVNLAGSYASGVQNVTVTVTLDIPIERTTDFATSGPFDVDSLNTDIDRMVRLIRQVKTSGDNAFTFATTSTTTASTDVPDPEASKVLAWNSGATALENGPTTADISNAATNASAAAASALAAATSETNAATSETNAANSAASAAASAQGFSGVTLLTASSNDVETDDARTYYQVDASSNTVDINLPSIGTGNDGLSYSIEVLDISNAITLVRDGTDTINGVAGNYTGLVEVGQVIQIIADDGTPDNWIVVQASALTVDDSTVELSGRTIRVKDDGIPPAKIQGSVNAQTGTTYTLVIGDAYKTVTMSNASANTLTIPTNASVAFSVGDRVDIINAGAGECTVQGDTGVTVNGVSAGSTAIAQYSGVSIVKTATDTWLLLGGTVA